ncbi:peroxisomal catalase [Niveomyces insectorum RCEF 264]|uniref:Peroxisomal catalase n=1 Tax=Niveomyces insectorum RCEF 264 TaxID=1081102 RepID=A0A167QCC2_9HYPO|nr:peroxisomal catalase [Niveomyces insectorum RCEF 264]
MDDVWGRPLLNFKPAGAAAEATENTTEAAETTETTETSEVAESTGSAEAVTEAGSASTGAAEFAFVDGQSPVGTRSHAMREYWKKKKRRKTAQHARDEAMPHPSSASMSSSPRTHYSSSHLSSPTRLRAGHGNMPASFPQQQQRRRHHQHQPQQWPSRPPPDAAAWGRPESRPLITPDMGIPAQALTGVNHALAGCRLDPFDMFPVKLTAEHHKLLHHWLSSFATMMFEEMPMASFNPMRDVWFPLDLSNAASFNAIMAHAAAHLARLHGFSRSDEAVRYKAEALRIVRVWMDNPARALSDEVFAAVIRLLTFEAFFVFFPGSITLMAKPSWFDSSNNIFELSEEAVPASIHPMGSSENVRRVRGLWLLSFIQDMNTFLFNSAELRNRGLRRYPGVQDAILVLKTATKRATLDAHRRSRSGGGGGDGDDEDEACTVAEFNRLACLFFISVLLQTPPSHGPGQLPENAGPAAEATPPSRPAPSSDLALMDAVLRAWSVWPGSVEDLHNLLFHHCAVLPDSQQKTNYVLQMTRVLASLSSEARRGVERCLLHILNQAGGKNGSNEGAYERRPSYSDNWTPDDFLSSLRGL